MNYKLWASVICVTMLSVNIEATSLRDSVDATVNINPDVMAENFKRKAHKINVDIQEGDYYPTIDFTGYIEASETKYNLDDNSKQDGDKDGWNTSLKIEQMLYDGGKTPNEVELYKNRYKNVKFTSEDKVEKLVLDTVNKYTALVLSQELISLDKFKVKVHKKYLKLAEKKEEISGEILDRYEVDSKIKSIQDDIIKEELYQQKNRSGYTRLTGIELDGNICRPIINDSLIPLTLEETIDLAMKENREINAQDSLIKEHESKVLVEGARYKPDLKLQLQGEWDDDLAEPENGRRDIYRARLISNWNLYNGGKDKLSKERERIFLLEQRKILDAIKDDVSDSVRNSYDSYIKIQDRLENLKSFIEDNKKIVEIYNQQLVDGSRTFIDVLNAETELFRTRLLYVETEFSLYDEYYNILYNLNMLSDSILSEENQVCTPYVLDESELEIKKELSITDDELAKELELE